MCFRLFKEERQALVDRVSHLEDAYMIEQQGTKVLVGADHVASTLSLICDCCYAELSSSSVLAAKHLSMYIASYLIKHRFVRSMC